MVPRYPTFAAVLVLIAPGPSLRGQSGEDEEFFETCVRPVLVSNCFSCHTNSQLGGLRLDSRASLLAGGKSGPAIIPGKPDESLLIRAISHTDTKLKMPLGGRLKNAEIRDITEWVKAGAPWPVSSATEVKKSDSRIDPRKKEFWSFQPLRRPEPPAVSNERWAKTSIDRFVFAKLEERGLKPARPADRQTLIRRANFDLIGLPPTPEEVAAFLADDTPNAFAKVVDRLLASPQYGVRWARYWLDIARYGEDDVRGSVEPPKPAYPNAWRYRDWVIDAFNRDMPYDVFVKAQIAGDLMDRDKNRAIAGLGFFGLGPWYYDTADPRDARANERNDRVDALTRGFLGLTVACARCHDHKYDPITTKDYYALAGVFGATEYQEVPLASAAVVEQYKAQQKGIREQEEAVQKFLKAQTQALSEILAHQASAYIQGAWRVLGPPKLVTSIVAATEKLDEELLRKWIKYLSNREKDHAFLNRWFGLLARGGPEADVRKIAEEFQAVVLGVVAEKKEIDENNRFLVAQANPGRRKFGAEDETRLFPNRFTSVADYCVGCDVALKTMAREKYVLWTELFAPKRRLADNLTWTEDGVMFFPEGRVERFLSGPWKNHLDVMGARLEKLKKESPPPYPYLHVIADVKEPADLRLHIRGSGYNLGEPVPRGFPDVLCAREPAVFRNGSGRKELAEAVASHPLTTRVMANRIWAHHFGRGIVGTPSNFGQTGERPSHPELLEYLASRFREGGWLMKALHREILLSATYQLGNDRMELNVQADPENRLLWRANRRRLDLEAMRDSLLFVSGALDMALGGPSFEWSVESKRRTIYGKVSRVKVSELLALFDFPDPSISSERRNVTNVPSQRLFFMNSDFMAHRAEALAKRVAGAAGDDAGRVRTAYRLLYGRTATESELQLGLEFLRSQSWPRYAQALLSSSEFVFVD